MAPPRVNKFIDTLSDIHSCLENVESTPPPITIVVDLEGVNLGREGRVSIMQLHAAGSDVVWLIDITTIGAAAFEETDSRGKSLRGLLEGPTRKVCFRLCLLSVSLRSYRSSGTSVTIPTYCILISASV